jgi:Phage Tail Collar Domain.
MDFPEYGLQGVARPTDFSGDYNAQLFVIRQVLSKVNVAAIVEILAVYGGAVGPVGYVDVQPLVNQTDGYGNAIPMGIIRHLPYMRAQGGTNAIIIDPQVGDVGICIFADKDSSSVVATGAQANPGSRRRFAVTDGIYLGGMLNGTPVQYIQFLANSILVVSPQNITLQSPEIDLTSWAGIWVGWPTNSAIPQGWLKCPNVQTLVNLSSYPRLAVLGTTWGGDGVTTVGLPYFAAGYVPIQGTPGMLSHGVTINHVHPYTAPATGSNASAGPYGNTVNASVFAGPNTGNPTTGGPDNLAAGMGTQFIVKY